MAISNSDRAKAFRQRQKEIKLAAKSGVALVPETAPDFTATTFQDAPAALADIRSAVSATVMGAMSATPDLSSLPKPDLSADMAIAAAIVASQKPAVILGKSDLSDIPTKATAPATPAKVTKPTKAVVTRVMIAPAFYHYVYVGLDGVSHIYESKRHGKVNGAMLWQWTDLDTGRHGLTSALDSEMSVRVKLFDLGAKERAAWSAGTYHTQVAELETA
jgi:hypothetical protein